MENLHEVKNLIEEAKNIYLIPAENSKEAIPTALALFYTLKQLDKNVNIIIENFPEKFKFLIPSSDFISYPRNFVVSIPSSIAQISQIYYEKSDEYLKIHLTIDKGNIKKDNISFYYTDAKPDLIISLGIKDFKQELEGKLNQFAFLMQSEILNIDNDVQNNKNFGKINLVEDSSLSKTVLDIIKLIKEESLKKESATCLLAGLINYSDNFTNLKTNSNVLEIASILMDKGGDREKIINELYKKNIEEQKNIVSAVLQKLNEQNLEINKENILKYFEN
jgi:nanoRNase/pAp phosphatase (c-di-AMP/oligoRNAs hydrolase)